jgi:bifunctional DNA-binding transcriptional regulator/antitoxin component of YhaV-PrlF toxin-antitoxin module
MNAAGRLTIPADARRVLGIDREAEFDVEVVEGRIVLRPFTNQTDDDTWAYTPKHRELVRRALKDGQDGRVRQMTEKDLRALAPVD